MKEASRVLSRELSGDPSLPVLERLFERLPTQELTGHYVSEDQTWSHRDAKVFSPVKNAQEM